MRIMTDGLELTRSTGSVASARPASKCVPAVEARWPPAEKPRMPTRSGSKPHSAARRAPGRKAAARRRWGGRRLRQHRRMMIARPEPVLQDEGRHADGVEPLGDGPPLVVRE